MTVMKMPTKKQPRYFWSHESDGDTKYSLIDRVSSQPVATIIYMKSARRWAWSRRTTLLLHGVAAGQGIAKLLADAKQQSESGLAEDL